MSGDSGKAGLASLRYDLEGKRDLRIDLLRGFCLFAMIVNHGGLDSLFHFVSGRSGFLITAADGFFFLSGLTVGITSVGRPLDVVVPRILRRSWDIYLATLVLSFGFAALVLLTDIELWEEGRIFLRWPGDLTELTARILTMRRVIHGSDVLISFVWYMAVAPLAVWGLSKGRTWRVLGVLAFVYALSQIDPEATDLPFWSLRHLASNSPVFFVGVVVGFHREAIEAAWNRFRLSALVDWLVAAIAVVVIVMFSMESELLEIAVFEPFGREWEFSPVHLVISFVYFRAFFLLATWLWKPVRAALGWLLLPIGQASLMAFMLHLLLIPTFWNVPGVFEDSSLLMATFWNSILLLLILGAAHLRSLLLRGADRRPPLAAYLLTHPNQVLALLFFVVYLVGGLLAIR